MKNNRNIYLDKFIFPNELQTRQPVNNQPYKAMRGKLIVAVDLHQKDDAELELLPGHNIWINKDFGTDGKVTNPTLAVVRGVGEDITDIYIGETVLCHHNTFKSMVANGYRLGHMGKEGNLDLFSIDYKRVLLKVDEAGNAIPTKDCLIVERIEKKVDTSLLLSEAHTTTHKNIFHALAIGDNCDGLKVGDKIITYEKSDYEIDYIFRRKNLRIIRIEYNNVLAIFND